MVMTVGELLVWPLVKAADDWKNLTLLKTLSRAGDDRDGC